MVPKNLFTGQQWRNRHREHRLIFTLILLLKLPSWQAIGFSCKINEWQGSLSSH